MKTFGMSKELSREELLRLGWVNIKTIKRVAPGFARDIDIHLERKRVQHAVNGDGYRQTNWYRLTPEGRTHIYFLKDNWAAKAFKIVPQSELEVSKNELWDRGWVPAYPDIYDRYVSGAQELGLLELRDTKRRINHVLYMRMTKSGVKFYEDFIKTRNKHELRRALSKVSTEKSRRKLRQEFAGKLKDDLESSISHFLYDCGRKNTLKRALHAYARSLGTKI
jgi:hypothetical protein